LSWGIADILWLLSQQLFWSWLADGSQSSCCSPIVCLALVAWDGYNDTSADCFSLVNHSNSLTTFVQADFL
jgi:hypothetical protein